MPLAPKRNPDSPALRRALPAVLFLVRAILGACAAAALIATPPLAAEISGRVTNPAGEPVPGARVFGVKPWPFVETDQQGRYTLPDAPVLHVWALGFAPETRMKPGPRLDIALKPGAERTVGSCMQARYATYGLQISVPPFDGRLKLYRGPNENEYQWMTFVMQRPRGEYQLRVSEGPFCCESYPDAARLEDSKILAESLWIPWDADEKQRRDLGSYRHDIRGVTNDGVYWRMIGTPSGVGPSATYEVNAAEAAKVFDQMLDNMCLRPPARPGSN